MEELKAKLKKKFEKNNKGLSDYLNEQIPWEAFLNLAQPYLPEEYKGRMYVHQPAGQSASQFIAKGLIKEWKNGTFI